ncbi:MAG: TIGR03960 family B12-binding radical SAM protein [Desulfobacteraceae bacterium]|nr:TIGR03960 family B12-binding radical SAM protein [Desulfobacteraceae bacterium]
MKQLDYILPLVAKPSRYIGGEVNSRVKTGSGLRLRMALAFPDVYEIGMSHFGIQILYNMLNARDDIAAERVFAPGNDMAKHLKSSGMKLFSLETKRALSSFDIIGFSLLYELNYTNVLMMLDLAGIPFYAKDRDESFPLVIAGGPCTVNPEPVAPFFDAMVIGDAEPVIIEMAGAWMNWKEGGGRDKTELLKAWSGIRGVYVPSFFSATRDAAGRQQITPLLDGYNRVRRAVVSDLDYAAFPDAPVIPFGRPVHDRLRLEIARGCTRGCRFCQAGMIYRPVRERSLSELVRLAQKSLCATGYEDLSLLSLSTGDYSRLPALMRELAKRYGKNRLALSLPSFRAGSLSSEMMEIIRAVRKTGLTIAPEAGTERLRSVINKNLAEAEIAETMKSAFDHGWQLIKLYFMIGLPTENDHDVKEIASLVRRLRKTRVRGRRGGRMNVSVATFIPKSHVPFQWEQQIGTDAAMEKIETVRSSLNFKGINFKWQKPELSRLEGVFARGDRSLADVLVQAWKKGCSFDGWSDSFNGGAWTEAFLSAGTDPDFYLKAVPFDAALPWDHIDTGLSREFLMQEYEKALGAEPTPDCRNGECQGCGVCDFKNLWPRTAPVKQEIEPGLADETCCDSGAGKLLYPAAASRRIKVIYSKLGRARFFGHLELTNILVRALRRTGIALVYSKGFNPKPRIAFSDALPVGFESMCESFFMTVADETDCADIKASLNSTLPVGLSVTSCLPVSEKEGPGPRRRVSFRVSLPEGLVFDKNALYRFFQEPSFKIDVKSGKGSVKGIDLKFVVERISFVNPGCLEIRLAAQSGPVIRPDLVIESIFKLPRETLFRGRILKLEEVPAQKEEFEIQGGLHG